MTIKKVLINKPIPQEMCVVCPVCNTHWNPHGYAKKSAREGHCPDCGAMGKPFTGKYWGKTWRTGRLVQK